MSKDLKLSEILEYGQGADDVIMEIFVGFHKFWDGYYTLVNYGDEWWKDTFNQSIEFDKLMKSQWQKLENADIGEVIDTMAIAMAGVYVKFGKFVEGVVGAYKDGKGYRGSSPTLTDYDKIVEDWEKENEHKESD